MFIHCAPDFAVIANLRCGHSNMYNYFGKNNIYLSGMSLFKSHLNPILVLRNPLDRVVSSMPFLDSFRSKTEGKLAAFVRHSRPYLHEFLTADFRIIDFYDLEQYIPRGGDVRSQSVRTDSRCSPSVRAEDVYVENPAYTLEELQQEFDIYNKFMATKERVSVDEWKGYRRMSDAPISYGKSLYTLNGFAGKTIKWCQSDSEEIFDEHMKDAKSRAKLEEYGWTKDNVSYTFNSDGFRSEEFTYEPDDSVLFLGCSLTAGIGIDLENTWTYKVASSFGLRHYNLGIGSGSSDTCFRLAHHWIPKLRPKYVMMLTPSHTRKEVLMGNEIVNCMANMTYVPDGKIKDFYTYWLMHPANAEMNHLKNVMGVQSICDSTRVPLVEINSNILAMSRMVTAGRDLMHPGREWNERVAQTFMKKLSELLK